MHAVMNRTEASEHAYFFITILSLRAINKLQQSEQSCSLFILQGEYMNSAVSEMWI